MEYPQFSFDFFFLSFGCAAQRGDFSNQLQTVILLLPFKSILYMLLLLRAYLYVFDFIFYSIRFPRIRSLLPIQVQVNSGATNTLFF